MLALFLAATLTIQEWPVPWKDTRPRDPAVDRQGNVWFVGQTGDYLGRLDPKSGKFRRFEMEEGTGPHNVIVHSNGNLWFAGNRKAYIGRFDPKSEKITKYPMPDKAAGDPHTLVEAPNGDIWFTVQSGSFVGASQSWKGQSRAGESADARCAAVRHRH